LLQNERRHIWDSNPRSELNTGILEQFESLLNQYQTDKPQIIGFLAVIYFADQLPFSPSYFDHQTYGEHGQNYNV